MQSDSSYATELKSKLEAHGITGHGAEWVNTALHPAGGREAKIPDGSSAAGLNPRYVVERQISAPAGITTPTWDAMIISPPSDRLSAVVMTGNAGADFSLGGTSPATVLTCSPMVNNPVTLASPELTGFFQASNGTISTTSNSYGPVFSAELPAAWRTTAASLTVYMTASDLYNGGTVYSAQFPRETYKTDRGVVDTNAVGSAWGLLALETVHLPLSEADMALMSSKMYTAPAKNGVYMPFRLLGPTQEFAEPVGAERYYTGSTWFVPGMVDSIASATTNRTSSIFRVGSQYSPYRTSFCPDYALGPVANAPSYFSSTSFDQHRNWGVTIFRGLHPDATLTVKTVTILEVLPTTLSPARQYTSPAVAQDRKALEAYYAIASNLPEVVAARHNFFGSILPILSSVASKVLPYVAPAISTGLSALAERIRGPPPALAPPPMVRAPRRSASVASSRVSMKARKKKVKIARKPRK